MNADSIITLLESADKEMDNFETPISDWDDIENLIGDASISWFLLSLSNLPLVGNYVKNQQFELISNAYEIIVNFVESHEEAKNKI